MPSANLLPTLALRKKERGQRIEKRERVRMDKIQDDFDSSDAACTKDPNAVCSACASIVESLQQLPVPDDDNSFFVAMRNRTNIMRAVTARHKV